MLSGGFLFERNGYIAAADIVSAYVIVISVRVCVVAWLLNIIWIWMLVYADVCVCVCVRACVCLCAV